MRTYDSRGRVPQARLAIGPVLVVGRMSRAVGRGVDFYGLTPVDLAHDPDQPLLLPMLVGSWLLYWSARR